MNVEEFQSTRIGTMITMKELIQKNPICAILRHVNDEILVDYAKALYDGGVRMFEVDTNTVDAYVQIEKLRLCFGDTAMVGAGTVINKERCEGAKAAGAQFFLTPSTTVSTMEYCRKYDIPLLPGVMTPTDVAVCLEYGYTTLKLFPAGDLPMNYIKSLKGPFDGTEYVAVGGVSPANARQFMEAGYIGVGIGSNLAPKEYVKDRKWDLITEYVKDLHIKVKGNC